MKLDNAKMLVSIILKLDNTKILKINILVSIKLNTTLKIVINCLSFDQRKQH